MNVLSLRGGGIKGLIPAVILAEFERLTGRPVREQFDLIVGTSTGGILALALAAGIPASRIVEMYQEHGPRIFKRRWRHRFGLLGPKYDIENLRFVLEGVFGTAKMGDGSRVMVTATALTWRSGVFIKSWKDRGRDVSVVNAACATSAAPTYFDPIMVPGYGLLMDGGLHSNNPALAALIEAEKIAPGVSPRIVDLACAGPEVITPTGSGAVHWAGRIVDTLIEAGEDVSSYHVIRAIESSTRGGGYLRIVPSRIGASDAMDNASEPNIHCLMEAGQRQAHDFAQQIREHIA